MKELKISLKLMEYNVQRISGNSFTITLTPVTIADKELLQQNGNDASITEHYYKAVKSIFGPRVHIASLTPNRNFPYSATAEMLSESGSV